LYARRFEEPVTIKRFLEINDRGNVYEATRQEHY
jgi:hypothetical protein